MAESDTARKIQVAAYTLLAGGFVLSAISTWKGGSATPAAAGAREEINGLGRSPKALPAASNLGRPKTKNYDVTEIDDRVSLIGDLIRKGALNSDLREKTVEILSLKCDPLGRIQKTGSSKATKYCVPEKNCLAEVQAIFDAVRNPKSKYSVRYTRDSLLADVFTAAERTLLKTHGGDCDDYSVTIGAMLMATGHPVRLRVVATRRAGVPDAEAPWAHIYLLTPTEFDKPNAKWISVDCSMDKPLGWEAPGASDVARTGKPSGIIARVRDYSVVAPAEMA
jgi:Transglutaminase-like superfamily